MYNLILGRLTADVFVRLFLFRFLTDMRNAGCLQVYPMPPVTQQASHTLKVMYTTNIMLVHTAKADARQNNTQLETSNKEIGVATTKEAVDGRGGTACQVDEDSKKCPTRVPVHALNSKALALPLASSPA